MSQNEAIAAFAHKVLPDVAFTAEATNLPVYTDVF